MKRGGYPPPTHTHARSNPALILAEVGARARTSHHALQYLPLFQLEPRLRILLSVLLHIHVYEVKLKGNCETKELFSTKLHDPGS